MSMTETDLARSLILTALELLRIGFSENGGNYSDRRIIGTELQFRKVSQVKQVI